MQRSRPPPLRGEQQKKPFLNGCMTAVPSSSRYSNDANFIQVFSIYATLSSAARLAQPVAPLPRGSAKCGDLTLMFEVGKQI